MPTATSDLVRVHPASPVVTVAVPRRSFLDATGSKVGGGGRLCKPCFMPDWAWLRPPVLLRQSISAERTAERHGSTAMSIDRARNESDLQRAVVSAIHEHWVLFLVEGVILVILGALAILVPPLATIALTILIGWLFLISGAVGLFTTFWMRAAPGFW
jgi:hypothetical protein